MLNRFLFLLALVLTNCGNTATVTLWPGDDIQEAVDLAPEGAMFILETGVYRQQKVSPKDGQRFIGKDGAVLNGAMVLSDWQNDGIYWIQSGLRAPLRPRGSCQGQAKLCMHREDLFVDGKLFQRVASLDKLGPSRWFYEDRTAYLVDDPSGKMVELSATPFAFGGRADGVVLKNLIVEKYASAAQRGAIDARNGKEWRVIDVIARWNHGVGIFIGERIHVDGGSYSHNGQMGMGGQGNGALIENVEIAYNNYAGFSKGWEAGGTKFVKSVGLIIRDSCVHHNDGIGIWTDIDNVDVLIDGNKVFSNTRSGIVHEISYKVKIRNNRVAHNGREKDVWLWGSQILIQNSSNAEVHGNIVEVAADAGNGISIIQQPRDSGLYGPHYSENNYIHHNQIIYLDSHGASGIVIDYAHKGFWKDANNIFDWNNYVVVDPRHKLWAFNGGFRTWSYMRNTELERNGTLEIERRKAISLSCHTEFR